MLRLNGAEVMGIKCAAEAGDGRAQREGRHPGGADIDAEHVGHRLVVVDRGQGQAEPRPRQQEDEGHDAKRHADRAAKPI